MFLQASATTSELQPGLKKLQAKVIKTCIHPRYCTNTIKPRHQLFPRSVLFHPPKATLSATDKQPSQPENSPSTTSQQFQWTRCWYPATALDYLDANSPQPKQITILGYDLVLFYDKPAGQWRCFRDMCPHRQAPLSEGRIDPKTHTLQCAYHGWRFSGTGACVDIPQAEPGIGKETACASKRSCALSYPTTTAHGLLWVWLDGSSEGKSIAETTPLPELPPTDSQGREWFNVSSWYIRDLEVDYVPLLENSSDAQHVHFTHAGYIGAPDRAGPITVSIVKTFSEDNSTETFNMVCDDPKKASFHDLVLRPPCMLWAASEGMDGGELGLVYFVVPVSPGHSRLMSLPVSTNAKFKTMATIFHRLPWLRHLYNHTVAAQDIALLHRQGTNMEARDFPGWRKGFYLPTAADGGTLALRKWLEKTQGGGVQWGPNVSPEPVRQAALVRESLFNNYEQHTKDCPQCSKALANVKKARVFGAILGALSLFGLAVVCGQQGWMALKSRPSMTFIVASVVGFLLWNGLKGLEKSFMYTEWRHSANKKL